MALAIMNAGGSIEIPIEQANGMLDELEQNSYVVVPTQTPEAVKFELWDIVKVREAQQAQMLMEGGSPQIQPTSAASTDGKTLTH